MSHALWALGSQPHRKNFAAKRSGEQGRQVTGPDFSAGQGYEAHPASIPRSKL